MHKDFDYSSLISLEDFNSEDLEIIKSKRIGIIGLGGIGSWALEFFIRSGFENFILVDGDVVEKKNLLRQNFLFEDIGKKKVFVLDKRFSFKRIKSYDVFLTMDNYDEILGDVDLIVDCTDNMDARKLINRISSDLDIPWIFGSALEYVSMVKFFMPVDDFKKLFKDKKEYSNVEESGIVIMSNVFTALMQVKLALDFFTKNKVERNLIYFDLKNLIFYSLK